ncbi:cell division ATP-binding protein FtsE [Candidatus Woesebacteria bacterium RIFCSPHIGHO2_01_FULL_39_23]|nr:MAG: cell division ATP-binding protein FtsE [Candidatus Woesebacteria bacterium RIFCSPHIGHO2_01_FULL_39_23]
MVKFENVTKKFGKITALNDVSFEIDEGEFVFLTGQSGAGKTTLLKILIADLKPTIGNVFFAGENIAKISKNKIPKHRQQIGYVFQDYKILTERTVRENIEVALAVVGISRKDWKKRVDAVLELVGLGDRSELFPQQLSGGEIQRVSIARALVVNPKILLADEPTGNLDWETAQNIVDLLSKINKEGKTVLLATHHEGIVERLKKRTIRLRRGMIEK